MISKYVVCRRCVGVFPLNTAGPSEMSQRLNIDMIPCPICGHLQVRDDNQFAGLRHMTREEVSRLLEDKDYPLLCTHIDEFFHLAGLWG